MKKLIAAAVAAAVVAPLTAMADGPVLYGKLHMSVESRDNNGGSNPNDYNEWALQSRDSRIGVKGSEDLGNGMKVGYLIEWEVDMDGNATDLGERNRAITLSGDWGTVAMGKWDTPLKTVGRKVDLFGDQIGDLRNLNSGVVGGTLVDARAENVVAYFTPNMNGFSATVAYVFDYTNDGPYGDAGAGTPGDDSDNSAISMNAMYENGPLFLGVAYSDFDDQNIPNRENSTVWRAAGSYAFGDFKILGSYTDHSDANGVDGNDPSVWSLGASYTMGNNTIKVQYADRDESDSNDNDEADMWAIGIDHMMSQRTTVYAAYASVDNDDASNATAWGQGQSDIARGINGEDADAFSVGIIHKF